MGKMTFIKAVSLLAPKLWAASIISSPIFSITPETVTIISGRNSPPKAFIQALAAMNTAMPTMMGQRFFMLCR